jgi:cell division septum initiation protein DivIVA
VNVHDRLNELTATVSGAKTMPMSGSCLVNRAEMLELLERLREELPADLDHADALLADREAVLVAGRAEAEAILEGARSEREQLIDQTDVLAAARSRAGVVTSQARAESTRLLADADDYVDRKLSEFEVLLGQLTSQVNNGRLRLTFRREADLARFQGDDKAAAGEQEGLPGTFAESGTVPDGGAADHRGPATAESAELVDPEFG